MRHLVSFGLAVIMLLVSIIPATAQNTPPFHELLQLGQGSVQAIAWRPDGEVIAVGGNRGVWLYTDTLELIMHWESPYPEEQIVSLVWSPDGNILAAGGYYPVRGDHWNNGTLRLWDTATGQLLNTLLGDTSDDEARVSSIEVAVAWSQNGHRLTSANVDCGSSYPSYRVWDVESGELTQHIGYEGGTDIAGPYCPAAVAWSPNLGRVFISDFNYEEGQFRIWNMANERVLVAWDTERTATPLYSPIASYWYASLLAWSPDLSRVLTTAWDRHAARYLVQTWNALTGEPQLTMAIPVDPPPPDDAFTSPLWVYWHTDNHAITSVQVDGTVQNWNVNSGQMLSEVNLAGLDGTVPIVAWSPSGERLAGVDTSTYTLQVWDVATGSILAASAGHLPGDIHSAHWSPDGQKIVTSSNMGVAFSNPVAHVWDATTGQVLNVIPDAHSIGWSDDGTRLYGRNSDGQPLIWDAETGQRLYALDIGRPLGWSANASQAVTINGGERDTLQLWDVATSRSLAACPVTYLRVSTFHNASGLLATGHGDGTLAIWRPFASSNEPTLTLISSVQLPNSVHTITWRIDGRQLASIDSEGIVSIWDVSAGGMITGPAAQTLPVQAEEIADLFWSPDGTQLFIATPDITFGITQVWDTASNTLLATMNDETQLRPQLYEWNPVGTLLATGGDWFDTTITLWDAATLTPLHVLNGHRQNIVWLAWSPDGTRLASAGSDGTIRIWGTE